MPFDPEFDAIYEELIKPALEKAGYEAKRADSFLDQNNILEDVVRGILGADLVVADMTTQNANVFYELGLAHGRERPTVLLAQSIDDIPFDLRSYRTVIYSRDFSEVARLRETLAEIANKHAAGELSFKNPLSDFKGVAAISKNQQEPQDGETDSIERATASPKEDEDDRGFLDFMVESEDSSERMTVILEGITARHEWVTARLEEHQAAVEEAAKRTGPGAARQMLVLAHAIAQDITTWTAGISENLDEYESCVDSVIEATTKVLAAGQIESVDDLQKAEAGRETFERLLESAHEMLESTRELKSSTAEMSGISREVTRATKGAVRVLDRLVIATERIELFAERAVAILDEKVNDAEVRVGRDADGTDESFETGPSR
jgi:hypothetical protein